MHASRLVFVALCLMGATLPGDASTQDPFDEGGGGPADGESLEGGPAPISALDSTVEALSDCQVTSTRCAKQNTGLFLTALAYVIVCVLLASIVRVVWNKRGTSGAGVRFFVPMLIAAAPAALLVGLDPARSHDLTCCLASGTFSAQIFLQDSSLGRAFLLGLLPAALLFLVVTMVVGFIKR